MKKLSVLAIVVLLLIMAATPAFAGWTWCARDPIVNLPDGSVLKIDVSVPEGSGVVDVDIVAPIGSTLGYVADGLNVELHAVGSADNRARVVVAAPNPVMVAGFIDGVPLGERVFKSGYGSVNWSW